MANATGTVTIPPAMLTTREFSTSNADALSRDQTRHLLPGRTSFNFVVGDTPTTKEVFIHCAQSAGTIRQFQGGFEDTGSSMGITMDLKKYAVGGASGSSVLSAAITFTHADVDNTAKSGTINTATYNAGDQFYALMTVSSSTGCAGPWAQAIFDEVAGS